MKKLSKTMMLFASMCFGLLACNEDEVTTEPEIEVFTSEETRTILTENISINSDGLLNEVNSISANLPDQDIHDLSTGRLADLCGQTQTFTDENSFSGPNVQWSRSHELTRSLICNDEDRPLYFDVAYEAEGEYSSNQLDASREAEGQWQVTRADDFSQDNRVLVYNGEYEREIERQQVNGDRGHTIHLEIEVIELKRNRTTNQFEGGTLLFTKTGENNNGQTSTRSGTIEIHDDCTATVTLSNGEEYIIMIC